MSQNGHDHEHGPQLQTYWAIFGSLAVLTLLTVVVSWVDMGRTAGFIVAMMIAISKASLVIAFFMHLKYDPKVIHLMCIVPTLLTLVLLIALLPDVGREPGRAGPPQAAFDHLMAYDDYDDFDDDDDF